MTSISYHFPLDISRYKIHLKIRLPNRLKKTIHIFDLEVGSEEEEVNYGRRMQTYFEYRIARRGYR
jgi:hypothetical protein